MYDYDWTDEEYRESLKNTPEPILLSQIDTKMDLRGLMTYAKEKGKKVIELTEQERITFVANRHDGVAIAIFNEMEWYLFNEFG